MDEVKTPVYTSDNNLHTNIQIESKSVMGCLQAFHLKEELML